MDIASISMGMNQIKLQNDVSLALAKQVMNVSKQQGSGLLEMLNQPAAAPHPTSGHLIDLKG